MKKKLVYEYSWSLIDRLLLVISITTILSLALWQFTEKVFSSINHNFIGIFATITIVSAAVFLLLLLLRRYLFSPSSLFANLRQAVSSTILDTHKLNILEKWNNPTHIKNMEEFYELANEMLDSIDDFYTCLLSPDLASSKPKGKKLSDYGLSFGIKRNAHGLLVLDKNRNLLPEQDEHKKPIIHSIIYESPAYQAGLRPGDIVSSIDKHTTSNCSLGRLYSLTETKSAIPIGLKRADQEITVELSLKEKTVLPVTWKMLKDRIGYLRLETFEHISLDDLKNALQHLQNSLAYIIDLRGNRGGEIVNALLLLSAFMTEGVLVHCQRRNEQGEVSNLRYRLTKDNIIIEVEDSNGFSPMHPQQQIKRLADIEQRNKPIIVLVDSYSMSGAELFAGAMQDHKRARILGTRTFGKGVGQDVLSIPPCVKVSVSSMRFTTPSGRWPGDGGVSISYGIEPDEMFMLPDGIIISGPDDLCLFHAALLLSASS